MSGIGLGAENSVVNKIDVDSGPMEFIDFTDCFTGKEIEAPISGCQRLLGQ